METILLSTLLPLLITGMSFISYKHPKIAFKILLIIGISSTIIFIFCFISFNAETKAYNKSIQSTYIDIDNSDTTSFHFDLNKITLQNFDSVNTEHNKYLERTIFQDKIYKNEKILKDSIRNILMTLLSNNEEVKSKIFNYYAFTIGGIIIFFFLANTFSNLWQNKSEENNNKADQTTE
nr:hypothetical protein [Pseudopedobacter sp.]